MNEIEAVTYAESREAFFAGVLRKAERQLDWAVKHNPDCYVCAEKGEAVAYYQDALAALREQAERSKGCVWCKSDSKVTHNGEHFCLFCSYCGKRLEVEQDV